MGRRLDPLHSLKEGEPPPPSQTDPCVSAPLPRPLLSCSHGGHPDLREAAVAVAVAGAATPGGSGDQGLADACRRGDRGGAEQHEPARRRSHSGPQAVRVGRPRTWGLWFLDLGVS